MLCPHCQSPQIRNLNQTTDLGYAVFRCGDCRRKSNERTGTPFNYLEFPTDIVFEIVLCRLRYKLSLRNLAEMFLLRGFEFTHEAVRSGRNGFARCWPGTSVASARGNRVDAGMSTKRTSGSKENGLICTAPLIAKATWWIRCSA